jgi:hypothetical protein
VQSRDEYKGNVGGEKALSIANHSPLIVLTFDLFLVVSNL